MVGKIVDWRGLMCMAATGDPLTRKDWKENLQEQEIEWEQERTVKEHDPK